MACQWTTSDLPDLSGRTFIITGANAGLGRHTAAALAEVGARVVLACRNLDKGRAAASEMTGLVEVLSLDLADLASVRRFADEVGDGDVLVNNAGIMAVPFGRTADGFELQFGTNYLGHYALTALLLPRLSERVVIVTSIAARSGKLDFDDLNWRQRRYKRWGAYSASKLADLVFAAELDRRLDKADANLESIAAHPGAASTDLIGKTGTFQDWLATAARPLYQSPAMGALPILYAAAAPEAQGGKIYGPDGFRQMKGYPTGVRLGPAAQDPDLGRRLVDASERLTGVPLPV